MAKKEVKNIFKIFFEGFKIYCKNFIPMTKGMIFPVFGQLIGIFLVFCAAYFYSINLKTLAPLMYGNVLLVFLGLIVLTLPGFFIFAKAFWDYMLLMVSLNNLSENIIDNGKLREIAVHTQSVALRTKDYISLLLIITAIWILAITLPFLVFIFSNINPMLVSISFIAIEAVFMFIATLISIYLSLSFQVFAFEAISPINVLKRSWELVEGNFWRTIVLCSVLFVTTSTIFPQIARLVFNNEFIINKLILPVRAYFSLLFVNQEIVQKITDTLLQFDLLKQGQTVLDFLSETVVLSTVDLAVIAIVLPLGSVCYTLLYKDIIFRQEKKIKAKKKA